MWFIFAARHGIGLLVWQNTKPNNWILFCFAKVIDIRHISMEFWIEIFFFEWHEMQNGKRDLTRNEYALIFDDKFQLKHAVAYLMAFRCRWQMGVSSSSLIAWCHWQLLWQRSWICVPFKKKKNILPSFRWIFYIYEVTNTLTHSTHSNRIISISFDMQMDCVSFGELPVSYYARRVLYCARARSFTLARKLCIGLEFRWCKCDCLNDRQKVRCGKSPVDRTCE